jgi:prepilin-type N-terminal cleavage/methylation domain-containing protein
MKTQAPRRQNGFTLVELLVVIAIIAVVAKVGFSAGISAIQKAKKTTALATCVALETAVNNFYTEYGSMPIDPNNPMLEPDDDAQRETNNSNAPLINALLGIESGTVLNTRAIKFLTAKQSNNKSSDTIKRDGIVYDKITASNLDTAEGLYDPWGRKNGTGGTYFVRLDANYDETLKVKPAGATETTLRGRRAAVWSEGADAGKPAATTADDVKTW